VEEIRRNQPINLPTTSDIKKFAEHFQLRLRTLLDIYKVSGSSRVFCLILRVLLCQLIQFNRRRGQEVSALHVTTVHRAREGFSKENERLEESREFLARFPEDAAAMVDGNLPLVIQTLGKCNSTNSIIIGELEQEALHVVLDEKNRASAGILPDNPFVFAVSGTENAGR